MIVRYTRQDGRTGIAEMAPGTTADKVAQILSVAADAWEEITREEADRISVAQQIRADMSRLDSASIRPLRAVLAGTAMDADREKLLDIETKIKILRKELAEL